MYEIYDKKKEKKKLKLFLLRLRKAKKDLCLRFMLCFKLQP